jgi:hypothetical protein
VPTDGVLIVVAHGKALRTCAQQSAELERFARR